MINNLPLLRDILNQPRSLAEAVDYQFGAGKSVLHDAARVMTGRWLLFSGMGSSLFACYALSAELAQRGVAATTIDTAEVLHYHYRAYRDAVAVLVSRSGESIETIKLLPVLQAQGTRIVGVTDVAGSTLAREADVTVLLHSGKDRLVAVQSYTATLITLHLLGAALLNTFDAVRTELESAIRSLADYVPQCVEQSAGWRSFFDGAQVIHLLGRGRSIASIYEGALLFNEVAKFPAVPMLAAQFRHGPVEIVDERYRAIVFAPHDQTRELDVALARDLARLGGQVRLIGPEDAAGGWWAAPDVSASCAPLLEIVPVQCAALRLAEWRGFTPGEFRVATQVTRSEVGFGKTSATEAQRHGEFQSNSVPLCLPVSAQRRAAWRRGLLFLNSLGGLNMSKTVKVGMIGAGFVTDLHAVSIHRYVTNAEILAVASPTPGKAAHFAKERSIPNAFEDYRDLLALPEVDVITVAIPNYLHAQITVDAARAGKHVICEKPLCNTLEEADQMIDECRKHGVLLLYAEELLFAPKYVRAKTLVDEGTFGSVYLVKHWEEHYGPHMPWFWDVRRSGGGVMMDMGCHSIEYTRWVLGKPPVKSVSATMGTFVHGDKTQGEDHSIAVIEYEGNRLAFAEDSWAKPGGMDDRVEIYGSQGHTRADMLRGNALITYSNTGYGYAVEKAETTKGWTFTTFEETWNYGFPQEMQHFVNCVAGTETPIETGEDGREVLKIIYAAYQSAGEGRKIQWPYQPPKVEKPIDLWKK